MLIAFSRQLCKNLHINHTSNQLETILRRAVHSAGDFFCFTRIRPVSAHNRAGKALQKPGDAATATFFL
jgi:hypothetical protein